LKGLNRIISRAIPLLRINVDTDAIIPSREMKKVSKRGLSEGLFAGWRYLSNESRALNSDFILNDPYYNDAQILLSGDNFGCGSSREHAVWALHEYGIRVIIAPSFGAIFYKNCIRNGILPIILNEEIIAKLDNGKVDINLKDQKINASINFEIAVADKEMLLQGLDDIDLNLKHMGQINSFKKADRKKRAWAYI
jgi:3-isopropylmalate/(R)-2-methylmalate dehydratase small subunit